MKKIITTFLVILLVAFLKNQASATAKPANSKILATAKIDKGIITIGDKITYSIIVSAPKNIEFQLAKFAENLSVLAIKDFGKKNISKYTKEYWFKLNTYVTGSYVIPPAKIEYWSKNGQDNKQEIYTGSLFVEVKSVLSEKELKDIKDIKKPLGIAFNYRPYYKWGSFIILISLIIGIVAFFIWKKRQKQKKAGTEIKRPAAEIAYEALENILKQNLIEQGKIKEYYFSISNVIRSYIEQRFNIMALEQTTEEFLSKLSQQKGILDDKYTDTLKKFLFHCDLVKFAKYGPNEEEIKQLYNTAKNFIDETKEETTNNLEEEKE